MKKYVNAKFLPAIVALGGGIGLLLRLQLYSAAVDEKNLLVPGHPLELLLLGLTAAVMAVIVLGAWPLYGSLRYSDNFPASRLAAAGSAVAAVSAVVTVLLAQPQTGKLFVLWKVLGLLCGPCLLAAAFCRLEGKRPHFLLHGVVSVFWLLHMICHYQEWSVNPQLQDYLYSLLASVALLMFSYYQTAFDAGSGKRRTLMAVGLAGGFFGIVSLSGDVCPLLYGGFAVWALTNLCSMTPVRRRPNPVTEGE